MQPIEPFRTRDTRCGVLAVSAALVFLGGCAFTDIPIEMPTRPLETVPQGGKGREVVIVVPFAEGRGEVAVRCGRQINGYGMDTADAICQSEPTVWIAERLQQELARAGFRVRRAGEEHRATALQLEGELLRLFVEPVIGFWSGSLEADLELRLRATTDTGLVADRRFFVKGWKGGVVASTAQPYHTSLHRSSQQILEEMVQAVIELMDRYPELGAITLRTKEAA